MPRLLPFLAALLLAAAVAPPAVAQRAAEARLKDLVVPEGGAPVQLIGYGLVVGLDRTGDRARGLRGSPHTVQSVANMLQQFGITVDPTVLASRNVAAVMVTATMSPFAGAGTPLDVTVSSLGDARSLSGGVLLQTPLLSPAGGVVHATAQGPISTGTLLAEAAGSSTRTGPTNTGRVPGGGIVLEAAPVAFDAPALALALKSPDFTNATAIADAIRALGIEATVAHAGLVRVPVPQGQPGGAAGLMARLERVSVAVDLPARVVINERTGTIVAGGDVRLGEAMVTYGSLVIQTQVDPVISQPEPFSRGRTTTAAVGSARVDQQPARSVVVGPTASVAELAAALNELGLTSRDVIAVFQALDRAGALQGELVIL